jgi:hypothetical protein
MGATFKLVQNTDRVRLKPGQTGAATVGVQNVGEGPIPPQTVTVSLPARKGLRFAYDELTVYGHHNPRSYRGVVSDDGQRLTCESIPVGGSTSAVSAWVRALPDAAPGTMALRFTVGDQQSPSNSIDILFSWSGV